LYKPTRPISVEIVYFRVLFGLVSNMDKTWAAYVCTMTSLSVGSSCSLISYVGEECGRQLFTVQWSIE
jgi:hypothetical protein